MHIVSQTPLAIPDVVLLENQRFADDRGYFLEVIKPTALNEIGEVAAVHHKSLEQCNESFSKAGVVRGLHTQCSPALDKLIRVLSGHIIDIAVDIRPNSPSFGQAVAVELQADPQANTEKILVIPFGFAHGFVALEDSRVQYFQTGVWSKDGESIITAFDPAIDWSHCDSVVLTKIQNALQTGIFSEKDRQGMTLAAWKSSPYIQNYQ